MWNHSTKLMISKHKTNTPRGERSRTTLKRKVFVATYTNEGLKFQIHLSHIMFEPNKRGRKANPLIAT